MPEFVEKRQLHRRSSVVGFRGPPAGAAGERRGGHPRVPSRPGGRGRGRSRPTSTRGAGCLLSGQSSTSCPPMIVQSRSTRRSAHRAEADAGRGPGPRGGDGARRWHARRVRRVHGGRAEHRARRPRGLRRLGAAEAPPDRPPGLRLEPPGGGVILATRRFDAPGDSLGRPVPLLFRPPHTECGAGR